MSNPQYPQRVKAEGHDYGENNDGTYRVSYYTGDKPVYVKEDKSDRYIWWAKKSQCWILGESF